MFNNKSSFPYLTVNLSWVHLVRYFTEWKETESRTGLGLWLSPDTSQLCCSVFTPCGRLTQGFAQVGVTHINRVHLLFLLLWWLFPAHCHNSSCPKNPRGKTLCKTSYFLWQNTGIIQSYIRRMTSEVGVKKPQKSSRDHFSFFCEPSPGAFRTTLSAVSL